MPKLTEDDFCPVCGDIIEPDDVTGEFVCLCGHGDDDTEDAMEYDNYCSIHGPFFGQVCVSCAKQEVPDNECNLHGPFHGIVCGVCYSMAKGMSVLASNPPDEIDYSYVGTLEREIERLLNERQVNLSRLSLAEKVVEAARDYCASRDAVHSVHVDLYKYHELKAALSKVGR